MLHDNTSLIIAQLGQSNTISFKGYFPPHWYTFIILKTSRCILSNFYLQTSESMNYNMCHAVWLGEWNTHIWHNACYNNLVIRPRNAHAHQRQPPFSLLFTHNSVPMHANDSNYIREVWADNLEEEMAYLRDLVEDYPYLAMVTTQTIRFLSHVIYWSGCHATKDTEFPGVVARPIGTFRTSSDYHYQTLRCNVDLLKIIQLGVTFADEHGNLPRNVCTWQFNFKFNIA